VLVAILVVAGCSRGARPELPPPPVEYVALGDSYTSGPLIPNAVGVRGCLRSDHNYPTLVAAAIEADTFRDASCSGATTANMLAAQDTGQGANPPQLDALSPATSVVTLGIGGNDLGFSDIATRCASPLPIGSPCQRQYVVGGRDLLAERIVETGAKVATVLAAIHVRSPRARVFVVGYPAIVPDIGPGCWPFLPYSAEDAPYVRTTIEGLNEALEKTASATQAMFVDLNGPTTGHDACQAPGTRWIEPLGPAAPAAPLHPNAAGMAAVAPIIAAAIDR
jgi:lysophospholipase L1-like esterase